MNNMPSTKHVYIAECLAKLKDNNNDDNDNFHLLLPPPPPSVPPSFFSSRGRAKNDDDNNDDNGRSDPNSKISFQSTTLTKNCNSSW